MGQIDHDEVVYNVMPGAANSRPLPPSPSPFSASNSDGIRMATPIPPKAPRKWVYITAVLVLLLALGAAAYYMLGFKEPEEVETDSTRLPRAWLQKYFNTDVCNDESTCGLNAGVDDDGLGNYDEFKQNTNPLNPDTDSDGLADGDEVNIFKTDPTLKYTDRRQEVASNDWSDGFQIKNGFDLLTPGIKMTEQRKQQIADDTAKYQLHEPSITTLSMQNTDETANWKTYSNTGIGFEFKYPVNAIVTDCGDKDVLYFNVDCNDSEMPSEPLAINFSTKGDKTNSLITSYTQVLQADTNGKITVRKIDGVNATELNFKLPDEKASTIIVFYNNNTSFIVGGHDNVLMDQVLFTFKFTK